MSTSHTIDTWIRDRARLTPARTAVDFPGRAVSYGQLDRDSSRLAAELTRRGLARGERVAVLADNCPEYVTLLFACAKAGLVMVPLNWRLAASELAYQIDHSGAALLVVSGRRRTQSEAALATATNRPTVREIEAPLDVDGDVTFEVDDNDPLFLCYTSGTSGRPKGAVLTHANCFWTNLSVDLLFDVTSFDVVLQVLPQFHIGGWNVQSLLGWWKGATVVLEPSFDAGRALSLIESKRVTTLMGVPANYRSMGEHPDFGATDLSSLRMAVVGGAPMPEGLVRAWTKRGVALMQGYGLTEASPNVLGLPPEYLTTKIGYAGKAYPHVEVALGDDAGCLLEGPATGELLVRGPNVFAGYWQDPGATAEAMRGGWLHTGDVAERDDEGFYRIRDRLTDMYISGGENVYPAEVESVLADHPAVIEVAVLGIPDERWGEVGLAVVVAHPPIDPEELVRWCGERLAKYKVPRRIHFVDRLPRSVMNKVLKAELAASLVEEGIRVR